MADKTAAELRRELAALTAEENALKKMERYGDDENRRRNFGKTRVYNSTKLAIVLVIIFLALIGTLGSMHFGMFVAFSMDDFVKFLSAFSPIFITLTGSIGLGGTAKTIAKAVANKNKPSTEAWGEDAAKGGM